MPKRDRSFEGGMLLGLVKDMFLAVFRMFGRLLGSAIAAGIVGSIGGGAVALFYGYPFFPWIVGGFVVCAVFALVLMVFVANDL